MGEKEKNILENASMKHINTEQKGGGTGKHSTSKLNDLLKGKTQSK